MLILSQISDILLLIAVGVGYIVVYYAKREQKPLQFAGYLIGSVIIFISVMYLITNLLFQFRAPYVMMRPRRIMVPQSRLPQSPGRTQPQPQAGPRSPVRK